MAQRWQDLLSTLVAGNDLTADQTAWAMDEVLSGAASDVHLAAFAVALRTKGETVAELSGMADQMLAMARPIALDVDAVDVVGTGGDRANTVNISTMSAITAAAAGVKVAKHGNRAASSACGTADVLEELGVVLELPAEKQQEVMDEVGIVFLFASYYHASLRHAAGVRAGLGIATTFNLLGPLANPARPRAQAIGIADGRSAALIAGVLARRGVRGMVFHGDDGLDELTTTTASRIWLVNHGRIVETALDPAELGIARADVEDLVGGGRVRNAQIVRETFAGAPGAVRDIVALNAAAALLAHAGPDLQRPVVDQFAEQLARARRVLDDGSATAKLTQWAELTGQLAQK